MNHGDVKVSIIMPVYNMATYLEESLSSLRRQTLSNIEILCIDDGSTDDSLLMLQRFAKEDARIRIFHFEKNQSAWCARKFGIEEARGEYILFMDADDTLLPEACEGLYREMASAGVDILHFSADAEDEGNMAQGRICGVRKFLAPYKGVLRGSEVFTACFREKKYGFTLWNKIYRAEICKQAIQGEGNANLPRGQDKLLYWMISYVATSYKGILGKCYYRYHCSRGGFGKEEIGLGEFESYCKMVESAKLAESFLRAHYVVEKYADVVKTYREDLLSDCVSIWWNRLQRGDKAAGFDRMLLYWESGEVIAKFAEKYFDQRDVFERNIQNAISLAYTGKKIKTILSYTQKLNDGGIERAACALCRFWVAMGYRVILLTNEEPSADDYDLPTNGVERIVMKNRDWFSGKNYQNRAKEWEQILQKYKVDAVVYHIYYRPCFFWDSLVIKANGAAVIGVWHTTFSVGFSDGWKWKHITNYFAPCQSADALVVLSDTDCAFFRYYNRNVHVVINPLPEDFQDWKRNHFIAKPEILWCGRLDTLFKNILDVLPIMKDVLQEVPDAVLHVVGKSADGKLEKILERRIKEENLDGHIILEGFSTDVKPWYLSSRVFLMTSDFEGYPNTLKESKQASLPCVMYELPYLTLCEGNRGILPVPQHDTKAAAKAIIRLLQDDAFCEQCGKEARAHIEELAQFDFQKKWREIFESVETGRAEPVSTAEKRMMDMLIEAYMNENNRANQLQKNPLNQNRKAEQELRNIRNGYSFRIGRIVTWFPRKLRGGIKCFRQHGAVYTAKRTLEHLGIH